MRFESELDHDDVELGHWWPVLVGSAFHRHWPNRAPMFCPALVNQGRLRPFWVRVSRIFRSELPREYEAPPPPPAGPSRPGQAGLLPPPPPPVEPPGAPAGRLAASAGGHVASAGSRVAAPPPAGAAAAANSFGSFDSSPASSGARQSLTARSFEALGQERLQNIIAHQVAAETQQSMNPLMQKLRFDLVAEMEKMFTKFFDSQRGSENDSGRNRPRAHSM